MVEKRWLDWPTSPVPGLSISTGGLLALADLSTIAKRTSLTGTSTWLDILVLAPGLHYQQQAETLDSMPASFNISSANPKAFNTHTGSESDITNQAMIRYLQRIGNKSKPVILDIGPTSRAERKEIARLLSAGGRKYKEVSPTSSKLSSVLYACGPFLTIAAIVLTILTRDWWGLAIIVALIISRAMNVWIIQQRTKVQPAVPDTPNVRQNWWVNVDGQNVCLRGRAHDLDAITTGEWMRAKTAVEGYVEAAAKIIVYLVAIFSGNTYQSGNIILIVLLSASAGLLALSNAHADTFNMNGRIASVVKKQRQDRGREKRHSQRPLTTGNDNGDNVNWEKNAIAMGDFERQETSTVIDSTYPFDEDVNYV